MGAKQSTPGAPAEPGLLTKLNPFAAKPEEPLPPSGTTTAPLGGRKRFHRRKTHRKSHSKKGRTGRRSTRS